MASEQELADMERMSNDWAPDVQGPLVGPLRSTQAIIEEYRQADPVYVHKTKALPSKFSHYRMVKGDGNCGWRALAFGYFETLLRLRDAYKIRTEIVRLKECNETLLVASGFDVGICEDFTDVTFELLEEMALNLPKQDSEVSLLSNFNNDGISSAVTYHFRLLTSAWMKMNPHIYSDFLAGVDVNTYVHHNIEPPQVELDHLGLQGLATSVINAAGIAIEVLYLDRSQGEEVTTHRLLPLDRGGNTMSGAPTIRLLYRPGHYDLLYKSGDIAEMAISTLATPEVRRVADPVYDKIEPVFSHNDDLGSYLLDLPVGHCPRVKTFSSEPYESPQEPSPTLSKLSPSTKTCLALAQTTIEPTLRDIPSASESISPPPLERATVEDKFRPTAKQRAYDRRVAKIRSEQAKAGFADDITSKREDQAHFSNPTFQPHIYQPGSECEHDS